MFDRIKAWFASRKQPDEVQECISNTTYTARFCRKRNNGEAPVEGGIVSLIDTIRFARPKRLDVFAEPLEPDDENADYYGVAYEITFLPENDAQRDKILDMIESVVGGFLIWENFDRSKYVTDPYLML